MVHRNGPLSDEERRRPSERCRTRPFSHSAAEMGIRRACASRGQPVRLDWTSVPRSRTGTPPCTGRGGITGLTCRVANSPIPVVVPTTVALAPVEPGRGPVTERSSSSMRSACRLAIPESHHEPPRTHPQLTCLMGAVAVLSDHQIACPNKSPPAAAATVATALRAARP